MNTICPKCGSDDTYTFFDSILKTSGFHCDACNHDFGVNGPEENDLHKYEQGLSDFVYQRNHDGSTKMIEIHQTEKDTVLSCRIIKGMSISQAQPITGFAPMFDQIKVLLIEKLFFLDWEEEMRDEESKDESEHYSLTLSFNNGIKEIKKTATGKMPSYLTVLDQLFDSLFQGFSENAGK
ncbi:MAG: hypothetical protein WCR67_00145 [Bacilli bacterium]